MPDTDKIKLISDHLKCLDALDSTTCPGGTCVHFIYLQERTGFDRPKVRRIVRSLARKGLTEYHRGLWSDEGRPAGAGYCITRKGIEVLKAS